MLLGVSRQDTNNTNTNETKVVRVSYYVIFLIWNLLYYRQLFPYV